MNWIALWTIAGTMNRILFMPTTTVHLPQGLLERVDLRAKALGVSRNRVIVDALESRLRAREAWSPELVQLLGQEIPRETADEFERSMRVVARRRASKGAPPIA